MTGDNSHEPVTYDVPAPSRKSIGDRTVLIIGALILAMVPTIFGPILRDWFTGEPEAYQSERERVQMRKAFDDDIADLRGIARDALTLAKQNALQIGRSMPLDLGLEKFRGVDSKFETMDGRLIGLRADYNDLRGVVRRYLYGRDAALFVYPPFRRGLVGPVPHRIALVNLIPQWLLLLNGEWREESNKNRKDNNLENELQAMVDEDFRLDRGLERLSMGARCHWCGAGGDAPVPAVALRPRLCGVDDGTFSSGRNCS